ncbi:MAG: hypothetical protein D6681_11680 [Calditrichaeota bacterium]|nr:MAG: hypothetical protein D6681_11680 [Calditrichota bacterium]
MKPYIIALITDFGTEDGYVGAMHGRILSEFPEAQVVHITHQIRPFDVRQAAFCLNNCYPYFPDKTVFVVVVDPGVGTERKGLVVKTSRHYFVGPDNGVFSFVYHREGYRAYEILPEKLPGEISPTFHGRDIFARLAAWLAAGKNVGQYLAPISEGYSFLKPYQVVGDRELLLEVLHVDHFGNLILNFHQTDWLNFDSPDDLSVDIGDHRIRGLHHTFGAVPEGQPVLNWDSSGYLQIAINGGNAARELNCTVGDQLRLRL